jgi:hypothetical protein
VTRKHARRKAAHGRLETLSLSSLPRRQEQGMADPNMVAKKDDKAFRTHKVEVADGYVVGPEYELVLLANEKRGTTGLLRYLSSSRKTEPVAALRAADPSNQRLHFAREVHHHPVHQLHPGLDRRSARTPAGADAPRRAGARIGPRVAPAGRARLLRAAGRVGDGGKRGASASVGAGRERFSPSGEPPVERERVIEALPGTPSAAFTKSVSAGTEWQATG